MPHSALPVFPDALETPYVRTVSTDRPLYWLRRGWEDTQSTMLTSLLYGGLFVVMGYLLVDRVANGAFHMVLALTCGFMLMGPFLAIGLYELSRRLERGQPAHLWHALSAWRDNAMPIFLLGLATAFIMLAWIRLSAVLYAVVLGGSSSPMDFAGFLTLLLTPEGLGFMAFYLGIGAALAALTFSISVVSFPMLLDDHKDIMGVVATSMAVVRHNPGVMLRWALLIVALTAVGLLTFYVGLALTLPIVGHATWHAYRDLVELHHTQP